MTRILIVEDETALREVYAMLFKAQQYEVHEAANGQLALEKMKTDPPDIIILDALMPVMGGIEFLKAVDLKKNYPKTKTLMLSNLSDQATISESRRLGAQKYLLKASVSPGELISTVKQLLEC